MPCRAVPLRRGQSAAGLLGSARLGMARHGSTWHGTARLGSANKASPRACHSAPLATPEHLKRESGNAVSSAKAE